MDLQGFSTPQQGYEGLYKLGDDLRQKKYAEEQRDYQRSQALAGRKDANDKYFTNLLNPKDYLTGTHYDPNTIKLLGEATRQAYELSAKGADMNQITMAISPLVQKVADYSSKAKTYQQNLKTLNERLNKEKGWNVQRTNELLEDLTFYTVDPKTGEKVLDVDKADPTLKTAMERIDAEYLDEVTTNEGWNAWADKFPKMDRQETVGRPNKYGSQHTRKVGVKAAGWERPEEDEQGNITFVPKYEVAADNKVPIQHQWTKSDGSVVTAPIRLLDQNLFEDILGDPAAARRLRAQVQREIKDYKDENGNPIALNSPKAELVARAIAYDNLKPRAGGVVSHSDVRTMSPVEVRVNLTGQPYAPRSEGSDKKGEPTIRDIFSEVDQKSTAQASRGNFLRLNSLSATAQRIILEYANKLQGGNLTQSDIKIWKDPKGNINIVGVSDNKIIAPIDFGDVNLPAQVDVKAKRAVTEAGKGSAPAPARGKVMSKADWMKLSVRERAAKKAQGYTFQ